jgi:hypothetical protein
MTRATFLGSRSSRRRSGAVLGLAVAAAVLGSALQATATDRRYAEPSWADPPPAPSSPAFRVRSFPLPASIPAEALYPGVRTRTAVAADPPVDGAGLPVRRMPGGTIVDSPTRIAIQALRRLAIHETTGDRAFLASARMLADALRRMAVRDGDAIWLPFRFDDPDARMEAPWVNALAQGAALALFTRLGRVEGRPEDRAFATGLFESFRQLRRPDGPWVSEVDADGYLWFEHYPGGRRGHVLNAHLYAVLGLRDYWAETRSPEALHWLQGGLATARERGPAFRRAGSWSWYNLRDRVAHPNYHAFHIGELRALAQASGDRWFATFADRLAGDYVRPRPTRPGRAGPPARSRGAPRPGVPSLDSPLDAVRPLPAGG